MSEEQIDRNFDDEDHDELYFNLIHKLLTDHRDRYELQTSRLLHDKSIIVESQGSKLRFSLTPQGCSYSTIESDVSTKSDGWVRMEVKSADPSQGPIFDGTTAGEAK